MTRIIEDHIEQWLIQELQTKNFSFLAPENLDPDIDGSLRENYNDVLIRSHL